MRSLVALLVAFFVSLLVGGVVQNQLAVVFGAREEFIAIVMLFVLSAVVAATVLGLSLALSKSTAGIDRTALALLVLFALAVVALALLGAGLERSTLTLVWQDLPILTEMLVPAAVMLVIQWWLVRRHWRKRRLGQRQG